MKRKFVKVMFFGALALSTVTYVGCKDYDDDVKGLQEQIDNINQKGADVTTEAMNAAISSAIAKVQADLDKIASKADKSALDALQAVVTKLQEAVNGKADASTLESLKAELNEAIATVDSSIQPKIDAAKTQLEGQIAGLETKLEEADEAIKGSIATQIADLKTELQDLMDANAAEYAKLYATKVDLNALSDRVETLEKIKHLTTDDVLSFIQTDADVKKYIDDEFVALLQQNLDKPESALRAYLEGVFTTDIMTQVEAKCGEIADTKMEALRQEWITYKTEQGEDYKAIVERLATLEGYNLSTMEELYNSLTDPKNNTIDKANTCFEALGDITDLATEFGKYTTTTELEKNYVQIADLNTKIGEYIGNSISDLDSKVETLETKLNALQSGLTSMLKSLVFAPQKYDASGELVRSVSFASIYTSTAQTAEGPVVISAPTSVKVNFRVSPASAVADLIGEHPKYTITTDKHVITSRAATNDGILTVASVEQAKDEADVAIEGMITVTLNAATAVKSYALSLSVVGNNEEGKDVTNFTEINSDYFAVIVSKKYINAVDYAAKTYGSPELLVDKAGSAINFYDAEKNSEYIKVKLSDNEDGTSPAAEFVTLASLGLSPDLFEVTFEKAESPEDADYFVLNPTTYALTVNQSKLPASSRYNKTCTVTPKIKVTTTATNEGQPVKVDYTGNAVTAKIVAEGVNLEYAVADLYWKDAAQTANLKSEEVDKILAKINEVAGASYESFSAAVSGAAKSTAADGGVTIDVSGNDVVVTIPAKTVGDEAKDYTFKPALTLTYANSAIVNITVDVKVLAPVVTDLKLGANTINWDGKSVVDLMPSANAQEMTALTVSRKLSEVLLATDIAALKKAVVTDKTVQLKITKGGDEGEANLYPSTINFDDFNVNATAEDNEVSYTFSLYYTPKDQDPVVLNANLLTVNLKPSVKVAGTITAPEETAIELTKLTDTYDLSTNFTWKEFRGVTIWQTFFV
jgi:ABC-type phosphate transport system auxiliary subunit